MFENIKIKSKLVSLFAVPLLAIVILVGGLIVSLTKEYHNATEAASIDEIKKIGNLIHQIQIERGLSAGFLASKGVNNKDSLSEQRKNVDSALEELVGFQKSQGIVIATEIMQELAQKRGIVDTLSLTPIESGAYYTNRINTFFEYYRSIIQKSQIPQIKNDLLAHYWLILAKDNLGQMRARLNAAFTINQFAGDTFAYVGANKTIIETALNNFENDANSEVSEYFKSKYQGETIAKTNTFIALVFKQNKEGNFNISSAEWFLSATQSIEVLKDVEDFSIGYIEKTMEANIAHITQTIILALIGSVVLIGFTLFLYIRISSNIIGSADELQKGLFHFFAYLNRESQNAELIKISSNDEFGMMAKVVNKNIQKTEVAISDDRKLIEEAKVVINRVKHGWYSQHITSNTSNTGLEQFKNDVNSMIEATKNHFVNMNVVLEEYANHNFTQELTLQGIEKGGVFEMLLNDINALRNAITSMLIENKSNGLTLEKSSNLLLKNVTILNQNSNEAAVALEETAASLEQITSNISNNTVNILQMAHLASNVTTASKEGQTLALQTTIAMDEINKEVSMINDAISIIDQIAFQTNILSLNAAVEAATAGEAGKGFAVVAGEVRNLATRSAEAANEIKQLISNATQKANYGKNIADSMILGYEQLNSHIEQTIFLIKDVEMASKEQLQGIQQINSAVASLDQQTQENASIASQTHNVAIETDMIAKLILSNADSKQFVGKDTITFH